MLSAKTIEIVKSTLPLLENAGVEVTDYFYKRMFSANPELKDIFNLSNQANGKQQFALFSAVAAYAKYIDNLEVLGEAVERIAQKHTSFHILPEQYPIVGEHLLGTLSELAPEQFTDEVAAAWGEAYQFLADILINREKALYNASSEQPGGWKGSKKFRVKDKRKESELVYSFTFSPLDGGMVRNYLPGQYIAVKVRPESSPYEEIRQYSLSDKYHPEHYRISVKRELNPHSGLVSNYLHDQVEVGDVVELMPPAGAFYLNKTDTPVVLISGGVGITPMMTMLETLAEKNIGKPVIFLHACANEAQHSFKDRTQELAQTHDWLAQYTWYDQQTDATSSAFSGLMDLSLVHDQLHIPDADFYLCGPVEFMRFIRLQLHVMNVPKEKIHYETFGPHEDI